MIISVDRPDAKDNSVIKKIVIVGGGSAGWLTAAHMSHYLTGVQITLVESPNVPTIGVGESTVPPIVDFMKNLGLNEQDWMPSCNATYKSAICFKGFHGTNGGTIWFPFRNTWSVANIPANRYWLYKHFTDNAYSDPFSIYRYTSLVPDICEAGKTVRSVDGATYAYHVDATALGEFLKAFATKNGVELVSDTITKVIQDEDGSIRELARENGAALQADLFIDCSGFRSLLLGQALQEPFEEYYDYLFNDSAIAMRFPFMEKEREMVSYTLCTALSSGWVWKIPLFNRIGTGYVYSGNHLSKDAAEAEYRQFLAGLLGEERVREGQAKHIDIRVGKHKRTWVRNCVGIGLSSGFVEPLESTGIQIVQGEIDLLTRVLQARNDYNCGDVAVYNASVTRLMEVIRDFLVCHYALTNREDTPYWRDVKFNTKMSESLVNKLMIARGTMPAKGNEHLFDTGSLAGFAFSEGWYNILTGMGHLPFDFEQFRQAKVGSFDRQIEANMPAADNFYKQFDAQRGGIGTMPSHYQYLKQNIYNGKD